MDRQSQQLHRGRSVTATSAAQANEYFEHFLNASTMKTILGYSRSICELLHLRPNQFPHFYPKLRANLTSWRAKALWKKFDMRASHKCYAKGKACPNTRVLIIGAGPCGLRAAIEAQLLGAKVVVVEKRDRMSRNNVLHLWPFVIEDLRMLGAKKFFGKFCAGAIDHISIRQLQCILLKVALLLGVEIHTEVSFEKLVEPNSVKNAGWRAEVNPPNHPVSQYEFDVIIGADGKRNTLQGFKRKEFRGKLAIAITANFINKRTEAEARVEEISGVAFIFNQKFFKDLFAETGIDLENIVYYKDDTHYFVMTAKKASLIEKGVIKRDLTDTEQLLAPDNVDREALMNYAREAADFSTNYQMPNLEFAVNHYGQPDVAMFDFTSMYAAENASKVLDRNGHRLLMILVGDSLLEPFWPTGSGCARGFLSSLDAAWAIRSWGSDTVGPLEVMAERESIYRLLAQTTPDNLNKEWKAYTLDPATRYPNLNKNVVLPHQVLSLFDTDNPKSIEAMKRASTDIAAPVASAKRRKRDTIDKEELVEWIKEQVKGYDGLEVTDVASIFRDGRILCAVIHHYRPDLLDYSSLSATEHVKNNQIAIDVLEKELGVSPLMTATEMTTTEDFLTVTLYLTEVYHTFKCDIPHIDHPKIELPESKRSVTVHNSKCNVPSAFGKKPTPSSTVLTPTGHVHQVSRPSSRHKRHIVDATAVGPLKPLNALERKPRKRRTAEKIGASVEERQKRLEEIVANRADRQSKRRQQRKLQTEQFIKSMQMLEANSRSDSGPFEDYSIFLYRQTAPNFEDRVKDLEKKFTYVPDHENTRQLGQSRAGEKDEDFAARIKNLEDKWSEPVPTEKKPRDLLRAIGKIETSDWNIKEIEKKINENKMGKTVNRDKEKVPKWSREQFLARQTKMEKQHLDRQDSKEAKFADIDKNIRELDLKLKEGNARELGQNKVASITEKFVKSSATEVEAKPVQRSNSKVIMPTQGSEFCHFCQKRVYLMERLSAEGRFFHHGCFKCQYCHTQLRLGSYAFDKDGLYGHKFYCIQHYGMQGELPTTKLSRKPSNRIARDQRSPEKKLIKGVDLLDRVQTPERVEFAGHISSEHDEPLSQMDEDEWTDRNFGASTAEIGSSDDDDSSSSLSDTESDPEDAYEEALEEPITKEGTMKWAERLSKRYARKRNDSDSEDYSSSDQSSYYENTSGDDDSETATEDEEEIKAARELRKQEVRVKPPVIQTDTGTDTEIVSDESSSTSSEPQNSATEISTDSEFAQDDPTPTREVPSIVFNDFFVTKTRGSGRNVVPKKIQITSGYVRPANGSVQLKKEQQQQQQNEDVELKLAPLVAPSTLVLKRSGEGYALNRTQSTGGIAAKVSLELKKKYLLGEGGGGAVGGLGSGIQKSGSASTLDFKFKSFHTNITDCQKLLKPALEALNPPETRKVEQQAPAPAQEPFENVNEGRPRSPVHETSIIVPEIDWGKQKQQQESDFNDSLSSDSDKESPNLPIPRVEVHEVTDDLPLDSLCVEPEIKPEVKSITSEKKELNQPKTLPGFNVSTSGRSTPSNNDSIADQITAALTETELSDWARDGAVSDEEFDEVFDVKSDEKKKPVKAIRLAELEIDHICGKDKNTKEIENMLAVNNALSTNLDNIEFMDTGSESSTGDELFGELNGYEQLRNEDEIAEDSLSPTVREFVEAANLNVKEKKQVNTGYCILDEKSDFGAKCIDLKPNDLEKLKENNKNIQSEEDSLLIFETGTTTEENTCSDSTVKNVTEKAQEEEQKKPQDTIEFDEHCRRLQSKVEFGNAKDSIDIRKSRRKSKSESPPKPDLIQEEKPITLQLTPTVRPVNLLYKKEEIEKERDLNQKLVQEMVMNKMKAQNKTLERKKRNRTFSPGSSPYDLSKSATTDLTSQINRANATRNSTFSPTPDVLLSASKIPLQKSLTTAEVNATTAEVVQKEMRPIRPLSVFSSYIDKTPGKFAVKEEEFKTPVAPPRLKQEEAKKTAEKLRQNARERVRLLSNEELGLSPEDKLEKLKNKLHRKDIDVHVQDSIESLVINTERRNSLLYNNDTLKKKRFGSFRRSASGEEKDARTNEFTFRTKSVTELARDDFVKRDEGDAKLQACKSDPNLLLKPKTPKKKSKDRERRKSITKIFSTLFAKKSGGTGGASRGFLARISPKAKDKSKSCINLDLRDAEEFPKTRRKSFSEPTTFTNGRSLTPPPVPPLPSNYPRSFLRDDSSDDWRRQSSCDTLDGAVPDSSLSSLSGRRSSGKGRKALRQTQLKRHRTAQEIQRKLEETEVKTRELEQRGVLVERALRGERVDGCSGKDESELMQEWFDLMRDRTELRRYERELMVRAQELELEDRHARLQQELRERLEKNEGKSEESLKVESCIINEMMEIVAKRDSLIALLEEDRIRYSEEDRDFEEQILSKGLKLTSVQKVATKH